MDLTVVIDGEHPDHRSCLAVAGKEHGPAALDVDEVLFVRLGRWRTQG